MTDVAPEFDEGLDAEVEVTETALPPLPPTTDQIDSLNAEADAKDPEKEDPFIEVRDQKWHTVRELPGSIALSLPRLRDDSVSDTAKSGIIHDIIFYSVVENERADFQHWLNSAKPTIDMNELMDILRMLVEKVLSRPTE